MAKRWIAQLLVFTLVDGTGALAFAHTPAAERTFDEQGRLQSVTALGGDAYRYAYDETGSAFVTGPGDRLVAIEAKAGTVVAYAYSPSGSLLQTRITKRGEPPQYFEHGVSGAPLSPSASANTAAGSAGAQPFAFAGEMRDPTTGLQYHRERWYDPATGRFLGRDPEPGRPGEPATLHPYSYAHNNPVNNTDPSGRYTIGQLSVASGILTGLASGGITAYRGGSPREIVQAGTVTAFAAAAAVYYGVPLAVATTIVYQALRQHPYLLGPILSRSVTPASLRTLDNVRRINPKDAEIIARAMAGATGNPTFVAHLQAVTNALRAFVSGGQLYPLGTVQGAEVFGSVRTGIGIVSIGGVTQVVQMRGGQLVQMLGPF